MSPRIASGKLIAKTIPVGKITKDIRQQMWNVFSGFYSSINYESFAKDLSEKNHVFLLLDSGDNSIQGFSTVKAYERTIYGKPIVAIYSGDTIVRPEYWGQKALHKAFFKYIVMTKFKNPKKQVYWYLISKGYKTYLMMARNFNEYWPRYDQPTPPEKFAIMDELAKEKFGASWKPELGTLQFIECPGKLKEDVAPIPDSLNKYPDIKFFKEKNPGHLRGDELCCLGHVSFKLLSTYPLKLTKSFVTKTGHRLQDLWTS